MSGVIIDGENMAGVRTSVSVHRVIYDLFALHLGGRSAANSAIRKMIRDGESSHDVVATIALAISRPSLQRQWMGGDTQLPKT